MAISALKFFVSHNGPNNAVVTGGDEVDLAKTEGWTDADPLGVINDGEFGGTANSDFGVENVNLGGVTADYIYIDGVLYVHDPSGTVDITYIETYWADIWGALVGENQYAIVFCFAAGTMIDTPDGAKDVATLDVGARVTTKANGVQTVRWVGKKHLSGSELLAAPHLAPIKITAGAIGRGVPETDLYVSPQHRMLVEGAQAELLFGEPSVLVPAKAMINDKTILTAHSDEGITYYHILFDRHEIIRANGCWSESFHPGSEGLRSVDDVAKAELFALFPELQDGGTQRATCLPALKPTEAALLH